jgi:hydroxymethylpyrimidine/phosphomethylpyrimidine kinase
MTAMRGRVLIAAGSDSGGGAGIQADIKTVTALGGYAATAITALTAQDTHTVHAIHDVPPDFIAEQFRLTVADIGVDAIKTGMLHRREVIRTVVRCLDDHGGNARVVVDPVMVAKGGARLLDGDTTDLILAELLPRAGLITPNVPEAAVLTGVEITGLDGMKRAAEMLLGFGPQAVLLKGGHMPGERLVDLLATPDGFELFEGERIDTPHTHGTGCTTASAVATGLAQGMTLPAAVARARAYVFEAIRTAPGYGGGHGPLNHAHTVSG